MKTDVCDRRRDSSRRERVAPQVADAGVAQSLCNRMCVCVSECVCHVPNMGAVPSQRAFCVCVLRVNGAGHADVRDS